MKAIGTGGRQVVSAVWEGGWLVRLPARDGGGDSDEVNRPSDLCRGSEHPWSRKTHG
jgi:hypothetical protein